MSAHSAHNSPHLGLDSEQSPKQDRELSGAQPVLKNQSFPTRSASKGAQGEAGSPWGESPERLRWRADMLMDEMMLGAVDVYAGEPKSNGTATHTSFAAQTSNGYGGATSYPTPTNGNGYNGNGHYHNGRYTNEDQETPLPSTEIDARPQSAANDQESRPAEHAPLPARAHAPSLRSDPVRTQPASAPNREPQAWIFSAEARYQQIARNQQTLDGNLPVNANPVVPPISGASPQSQPWMVEEPPASRPENSPVNGLAAPELGPVRRTAAQVTGAMTTPNRNGKWSNLLPRMSTVDTQTLQQEINSLHSEIGALLPAGHETRKHAHHLLEKAQAILQDDALRAAEVEYYVQQVRTIFQRIQQTLQWSNLYRNRLAIYLGGWSCLSMIVIAARYLYQVPIEQFTQEVANLSADSFILRHIATALCTVFSGALGGALGTLLHLRLHSRLEHGFFDRKYSLRGLILPVMGALFGLLLYTLVGLLLAAIGVDPAQNLGVSTLPAVLAFIFGLCQESLYGTRESVDSRR